MEGDGARGCQRQCGCAQPVLPSGAGWKVVAIALQLGASCLPTIHPLGTAQRLGPHVIPLGPDR